MERPPIDHSAAVRFMTGIRLSTEPANFCYSEGMKRAFITAATSSIGSAITRQLADQGYGLVLHYYSNKELAGLLAKASAADLLQADLKDPKDVLRMLASLKQMPKFDVIINNAGKSAELDENDISAWEAMLRVCAVVPGLIMAAVPELMNPGGVILNISSIYGNDRFGYTQMPAFNAGKAALNSLTRTYAKKLAPAYRVNAIAPGFVNSSWNKNYPPAERRRIEHALLTNKLVEPDDVADLACHIINNQAIDGEIIYLDGGQTLKSMS